MVRTAIDSYDPEFGYTTYFNVGGVFVLGVGSMALGVVLMILWNIISPKFFGGSTLKEERAPAQ
jgi:hypothetical protein